MNRAAVAALGAIGWIAVTSSGAAAPARDYSSLYDDRLLQSRTARYQSVLIGNLQNHYLPKLTPQERRALPNLVIEVPPRVAKDSLLGFYSTSLTPPRIVMPAQGIRLLGDLALAYAWLHHNGYTTESVADYVSVLKYQELAQFGGRWPDPIRALGIPDNAEADQRVAAMSARYHDEMLAFVFLHELGHVVHGHPGNRNVAPELSRRYETEADRFALEVMRRVGLSYGALMLWFIVDAHAVPHRADYGSDAEYQAGLKETTHPLTAERFRQATAFMRAQADDNVRLSPRATQDAVAIRLVAEGLDREVVPVLADVDQQLLMAMRGTTISLAGLQPRRPGELIAMPQPAAGRATQPFEGVYDGQFTDRGTEFDVRGIFRRRGDSVSGTYSWGAGEGTIEGVVEGNTLAYRWRMATYSGRGRLRISADGGRFEGSWGSGEQTEGRGLWKATRAGR